MNDLLLNLTADIVSAQASNSYIAPDHLPELIRSVFRALSDTERQKVETASKEPAVLVKKSVFSDHILCLECGKKLRTLKRHLYVEHKLTPDEYRTRFRLPGDYPLIAPEYAEIRSEIAQKTGLGRDERRKRSA